MNATRRLLVPLLVLAATLSACGARAPLAESPGSSSAGRTYVIVHGAWGCGCDFAGVEAGLRAAGHRVFRPSLTGLGERVHLASAEIDLETHIQDVVNLLVFERLTEVVLVGHSYGGMVISGAADRVPERIGRLVYLDAFVPEDGESVMALAGPGGEALRASARDGFLIPVWVRPGTEPPHDVPHPLRTFEQPIALTSGALARLPATYILTMDPGATEDMFSPYAARARAHGWEVQQMEADHNPQRSALPELIERLLGVR